MLHRAKRFGDRCALVGPYSATVAPIPPIPIKPGRQFTAVGPGRNLLRYSPPLSGIKFSCVYGEKSYRTPFHDPKLAPKLVLALRVAIPVSGITKSATAGGFLIPRVAQIAQKRAPNYVLVCRDGSRPTPKTQRCPPGTEFP